MSDSGRPDPVDVPALLKEVDQRVEEKKASGFYDPAEVRRVEEAAVDMSAATEAGQEAEVNLRHAQLQGLWDAGQWGVTTHQGGAKAKLILGLKRLIYKLSRFPASVLLARQISFNDELVKLLNVMVPQHLELRQRLHVAEVRLDEVRDLVRNILSEHGRRLDLVERSSEARLSALEREATKGSGRTEELLARLQGILEQQARAGLADPAAAQAVADERGRARGAAYLAFEDLHRGAEEDIRGRQEVYLPIFRENVSAEAPLVDLGCGRGEFLELCRREGLPARGVDINPAMVEACRAKGLEVEEGDAIGFLRGLPDASLGGILAAQVIEHLELDQLTELVSLAATKLRPGAAFAAETINPECLSTFAGAFYLDLTHQKPIHPEAARFLWRGAGLGDVEILRLSPHPEDHKLESFSGDNAGLAGVVNRNVSRLNGLLFGYRDYAVVGRR